MSRVRHSTGRRRRKHEEHANHEAWAIPYADLLTLLLAFFVVMYAISSVNAGKYRVLSDSLFAAFRGAPRSMEPIQVGDRPAGSGEDPHPVVAAQSVLDGHKPAQLAAVPVQVGLQKPVDGARPAPLPPQAAAAAAALGRLADQVELAMSELVQKDMVSIRRSDFWIEVEMRTDILFPSGSARFADSATDVIQRLGTVLAPFPNPIRVEGHTDDVPIKTALFYSNWELSAARAASVVRVLSDHGVAPNRLAVIGYGEQRPRQPNDTAEGRNANRRVVIVILSTELMQQPDPAQLAAPGAAPQASPAQTPQTAPVQGPTTQQGTTAARTAPYQTLQPATLATPAVPTESANKTLAQNLQPE